LEWGTELEVEVAAGNDAAWKLKKSVATTRHKVSAFNWKIRDIKMSKLSTQESREIKMQQKYCFTVS